MVLGGKSCLFTNIAVSLCSCNWYCSWFFFLILYIDCHFSLSLWDCNWVRAIWYQRRWMGKWERNWASLEHRGVSVQVSYCIWGGSCLNTGSYKNSLYSLSDNQIWEGGSQSQGPHFWNLELCCWTLGTCRKESVTDTNLRRQINAKKEGKIIC